MLRTNTVVGAKIFRDCGTTWPKNFRPNGQNKYRKKVKKHEFKTYHKNLNDNLVLSN